MSQFILSSANPDGTSDLYVSDGTASGTVALDLAAFGFIGTTSHFADFTGFDGRSYFFANTVQGGDDPIAAIFSTAGTAASTAWVQTGATSGVFTASAMTALPNAILISGKTEFGIPGVWASTDGVRFSEIASGVSAGSIAVAHGIGYFNANNETINGVPTGAPGLWRTDGTAAGTRVIDAALDPSAMISVKNGRMIFINQDTNGGGALWVTDGTNAGTYQIVDPALGTRLQTESGTVSVNGMGLFAAIDAKGEISVWASDGSRAGTSEIAVIGQSGALARMPGDFIAFGAKAVFDTGRGLDVTDGTAKGTYGLTASQGALGDGPDSVAVAGGKLFYTVRAATGAGSALFVTANGTNHGTIQLNVPNLASIASPLAVVGSSVVFEGTDRSGHAALFEADGTTAGSRELSLPAGVLVSSASVISALSSPTPASPSRSETPRFVAGKTALAPATPTSVPLDLVRTVADGTGTRGDFMAGTTHRAPHGYDDRAPDPSWHGDAAMIGLALAAGKVPIIAMHDPGMAI